MRRPEFLRGDRVHVLAPYMGEGTYGRDEWTGRVMVVAGVSPAGEEAGCNYRLAGSVGTPWEVLMYETRLVLIHARPGV